MLDLDYIREINETYGHGTGDKILIQVSRTLQELADDQGSVTKFGGDDFIIICRQSSVEEAAQRAQRILLAIKQPLLIDGRSFPSAAASVSPCSPTMQPTRPTCWPGPTWPCHRPKRPAAGPFCTSQK